MLRMQNADKSGHVQVRAPKVPFYTVGIWAPNWTNTCHYVTWVTQVHIPYSISIGSAVLAQLMLVTNRQTHWPRYNGNNRPHLMLCIATWPNLYYYQVHKWGICNGIDVTDADVDSSVTSQNRGVILLWHHKVITMSDWLSAGKY